MKKEIKINFTFNGETLKVLKVNLDINKEGKLKDIFTYTENIEHKETGIAYRCSICLGIHNVLKDVYKGKCLEHIKIEKYGFVNEDNEIEEEEEEYYESVFFNKIGEKMEEIKIVELFSGIGAPRKALTNLGVNYTSLGYSEIDKHAIKSYCAIHNDIIDNNYGSITEIKELPKDIDILFHGSPCQDFSIAGKGEGGEEGTETRSSLMWETVRLVKQSLPKVVIWENVKGVLSKKHILQFNKYLEELEKLGYKNTYKVLNARDFGVPQNRERIFVISIKNGAHFTFNFDNLKNKNLKPLKNYIDFNNLDKIIKELNNYTKGDMVKVIPIIEDFIYPRSKENKYIEYGSFTNTNSKSNKLGYFGKHDVLNHRVYKMKDIVQCLTAMENPYYDLSPNFITESDKCRILAWKANTKPFKKILNKHNKYIGCITCRDNGLDTSGMKLIEHTNNVRKILPHECFRLMGFDDTDYIKASGVCTAPQLYKQAGNSIVVDVLEAIFIELLYKKRRKNEIIRNYKPCK